MRKFLAYCILLPLYLVFVLFLLAIWLFITCLYPWYWAFETTAGKSPRNYKTYFKTFFQMVEGISDHP